MTPLESKLSEMAEKKIEEAASDYEGKYNHPRHWDCCYHSGDTEKHFSEGAKWALAFPEVAELVEALKYYANRCPNHPGIAPQCIEMVAGQRTEYFGEKADMAIQKWNAFVK